MLFAAPAALAQDDDIPPKFYRQLQDRAPEALTIRVEAVTPAVTSERRGRVTVIRTEVNATATVVAVNRSLTNLKPGDRIRIQYTSLRAEPAMEGPRPVPVLKGGQSTPAFLLGVRPGIYGPAARGASFEALIDAR